MKKGKKTVCFLIVFLLLLAITDAPFVIAKTSTKAQSSRKEAVNGTSNGLYITFCSTLPDSTMIPAQEILTGTSISIITGSAVTITPSVIVSTGQSVEVASGPSAKPVQEPPTGPAIRPSAVPTSRPAPTAKPAPKPTPKPTPGPVKDKTPFKITIKKAGREKLCIAWAKRKSASKYKVWQKKQGAKKWRVIKTTRQLKYNVRIKTGRRYRYKVTAIFGKKMVIDKTEKITACIPDKAISPLYKRVASNKVNISWKRGKCTKDFIIYRKAENGSYKKIATVKKAKYKDDSVAVGKKYVYKILPVYNNEKVKIYGSNTYIRILLKDEVNTDLQNYSYEEMQHDIEALGKLYGKHFKYNIIGKSADGRNIYDLVIGSQYAGQSMLVVAQLHAREYMTSQLCMKQIEYYLQNYNEELDGVKVSDVLNKVAIHYVPMANPDGASISQSGFLAIKNKSLRKKLLKMPGADNPSLWKANARGVDLNKNYPYEYVAKQGERGSEGYTGSGKCSETETKAIMALVNKLKNTTTVKGQINYHATGSIVFGEYEGPLKKTINKMYTLACYITGYKSAAGYNGGNKSVGNLREFIMYNKNLPSITLEIGKSPCPLPKSEFNDIWKRNKNLVLRETDMLIKP